MPYGMVRYERPYVAASSWCYAAARQRCPLCLYECVCPLRLRSSVCPLRLYDSVCALCLRDYVCALCLRSSVCPLRLGARGTVMPNSDIPYEQAREDEGDASGRCKHVEPAIFARLA